MSQQEFFDFGFAEDIRNENFIVSSSNFQAFSYIEKWPAWDAKILLIYGPKASGKSNLAQIWQRKSGAKYISAADIYSNNYVLSNNHILEDIEKVHDEAALLHFFNSVKEMNKGYLLLSANSHPLNLGVRLPDLRSRLSAVPSAGVSDPDDDLLRAIFLKEFTDRQLKVDMDVINYLITRIERSFEQLYKTVEMLDKQALKEKKNITIPFARKMMESGNLES
jgi:chromosomal replication initiation ATPase DnaA